MQSVIHGNSVLNVHTYIQIRIRDV